MSELTLTAGVGRANITPPAGTRFLGYILRIEPATGIDTELKWVRIDGLDGKAMAAIVNYAAHAVVLGPDPMRVSAGYPGVVREVVERATGAMCVCLMGAAGDEMPVDAWRDDTATVREV